MAKLLAHWDRTTRPELGDALAALVGRSDDEVDGIRRLFDEIYAPPPPLAAAAADRRRIRSPWLRRYAWSLAAVGALVMLVWPRPSRLPAAGSDPGTARTGRPAGRHTDRTCDAVTLPPPPRSESAAGAERVERRPAAEALGGGFLVALALFWSMKVRDDTARVAREAWSAVRARAAGSVPFQRDRARPSGATAESRCRGRRHAARPRVQQASAQARELDVPRNAAGDAAPRADADAGHASRGASLRRSWSCRTCRQEMRLWDAKVEGFLSDLRRQGVALQRMYFDGDLTRRLRSPHRPATSMDTVLRASLTRRC